MLDGLGLNYNTAAVGRRAARAATRTSSSSSPSRRRRRRRAASTRIPTSSTPARTTRRASAATSSYDNNLASWTMSGEYGLKKDRDRKYFQGEFLWSGIDYIGEPTPYDVFPVKSSFFGAVDTAGFPKDAYWLFRSQWTREPMVHLRADELDRPRARRARSQVWAYANVDTVELFLNGAVARRAARSTTRRRPTAGRTSRRPRRRATTRPSPRARTRAATRARTAAPASCT